MAKKTQFPLSIRLPKPQLDFVKKGAELNCRTVSGQTEFMLGIAMTLQINYPEVFNEISLKINDELKKLGKE